MEERAGLKELLDEKAAVYETPAFIIDDPISLPHQFSRLQDIEIVAFWVAILAWGRRETIIDKGRQLVELMGNHPHDFILHHTEQDRKAFRHFKHRTFHRIDAYYFLRRLQEWYRSYASLEEVFLEGSSPETFSVERALSQFHDRFFSLDDAPARTCKHIASPAKKSTCKRLNMFLRWMVRSNEKGVDFGLWNNISPAALCQPLDVHVENVARHFGLLSRKTRDWKAVEELTGHLRAMDPDDPIKYDFALFGMGRYEPHLLQSE